MIGYFKTVKAGIQNTVGCQPRIINKKEILDLGIDKIKNEKETLEEAQETLAEKIANGQYIEPYNFQSKTDTNSGPGGNGYLKIGSDEKADPMHSTYFWVDELKNWCTYRVWAGCPVRAEQIVLNVYGIAYYDPNANYSWQPAPSKGFNLYSSDNYNNIYDRIIQVITDGSTIDEQLKQDIFNQMMSDNPECPDLYLTPTEKKIWRKSIQNDKYWLLSMSATKTGTEGYKASVIYNSDHWEAHTELSYYKDIGLTALQLCAWNGVDGFVPINVLTMTDADDTVNFLQNTITSYIMNQNGYLLKHRGVYNYCSDQTKCGYQDPKWKFSWDSNVNVKSTAQGTDITGADWYQSPCSILHGIILERNRDYSIYDKSTFQCRRLGKPYFVWYTNNFGGVNRSDYDVAKDRAATRQGMSTGNPGVFRTSTGELALATMLVYGGVTWLFGDHGNGFDTTPVNFLNDICKEFFGDGMNKTCAKDWLKLGDNINTNDEMPSGDIQTLYETSLDKTLNAQMDKATDEHLSMSLTTEDVAVEIEEEKKPDYAVKW